MEERERGGGGVSVRALLDQLRNTILTFFHLQHTVAVVVEREKSLVHEALLRASERAHEGAEAAHRREPCGERHQFQHCDPTGRAWREGTSIQVYIRECNENEAVRKKRRGGRSEVGVVGTARVRREGERAASSVCGTWRGNR